jgi:hypothetical protein
MGDRRLLKQPFACIAAAALVAAAGATTVYVDDDTCPEEGSGTQADPYCSIAVAIHYAADADAIVVAPGTYLESIDFLGKAVTVRSLDPQDAAVVAATIIDGTGHAHVVRCVSGEGPASVLSGFTITGGNADAAEWPANCGGGMLNIESGPTVSHCVFSGNAAAWSGGGMYNSSAYPTVTDCTFDGNSADNAGAGMFNNTSDAMVTRCAFINNAASNGGGGMYNEGGTTAVTDCTFTANTAGHGGGIANMWESLTLINCTFRNNVVPCCGGGMYTSNTPAVATNCTFIGNSAGDLGGGGAWKNLDGSPTLTNCVLWDNHPIEITTWNPVNASYCDVQGGWPGPGNIDADPLCVDPAAGDLRLSAGSPCIDAGFNWAIASAADTDLDGNPRIADGPVPDTGCGVPVVVDIGAYEYQGLPVPVTVGDIDGNGAVTVNDFLLLLADWGPCVADCCLADVDASGDVGVNDFLILLANWE